MNGTYAALAVPNFRRYVAGQSLSLIGTWVETVAQARLVLRLTHSGTILGLTTAARYLPILLLSPYAGLVVDRHSRRRVLLLTQAGLGLVSATLGVSMLTGRDPAGAPGPRGTACRPALRRPGPGDRPAAADDGADRHVHVRVRGEPAAAAVSPADPRPG
jgi:hypothetical protein